MAAFTIFQDDLFTGCDERPDPWVFLLQPIMPPKYRNMEFFELESLSDLELTEAFGTYGFVTYLYRVPGFKDPVLMDFDFFCVGEPTGSKISGESVLITDYTTGEKITLKTFWSRYGHEFKSPVRKGIAETVQPDYHGFPHIESLMHHFVQFAIEKKQLFQDLFMMTIWNASKYLKAFEKFVRLVLQRNPDKPTIEELGFVYNYMGNPGYLFTKDWRPYSTIYIDKLPKNVIPSYSEQFFYKLVFDL